MTDGSFAAFILYQQLCYAYVNWRYSSENIELSTSLNLFMHGREHPTWTVTPAYRESVHQQEAKLKVVDKCFDVEPLVKKKAHLSPFQLVFV